MGTFIIRPTISVGPKTSLWSGSLNPGDTSDAQLLAGINNTIANLIFLACGKLGIGSPDANTSSPFIISFDYSLSDAIIELDGNPAISFNNLPGGFVPTQADLIVGCRSGTATAATATVFFTIQGNNIQKTVVSVANASAYTIPYDFSFPAPTMLDILLDGIGIEFNFTLPNDFTTFYTARIVGTYEIQFGQWTLENPGLVEEGSEIVVTSDPGNPEALDFEQVETVTLEFIDENGDSQSIPIPEDDWITVETNEFMFVASFGGFQPQTFSIVITSTQFSGSVTLGTLATIFFTSATGIYRLETNKRSDTLYVETDPGETVDVAIPTPFWKSGYIGG